jgi:hypothetical protein
VHSGRRCATPTETAARGTLGPRGTLVCRAQAEVGALVARLGFSCPDGYLADLLGEFAVDGVVEQVIMPWSRRASMQNPNMRHPAPCHKRSTARSSR